MACLLITLIVESFGCCAAKTFRICRLSTEALYQAIWRRTNVMRCAFNLPQMGFLPSQIAYIIIVLSAPWKLDSNFPSLLPLSQPFINSSLLPLIFPSMNHLSILNMILDPADRHPVHIISKCLLPLNHLSPSLFSLCLLPPNQT